MLRVLLDNRQNAGGDDAMRLAEIAVDLLQRQGDGLLQLLQFLRQRQVALRGRSRHDYDCVGLCVRRFFDPPLPTISIPTRRPERVHPNPILSILLTPIR